jgi:hypothetical protein
MLSVIVGAVGRWNHSSGVTLWESGTVVSPRWEFRGDGTSDGVVVQLLEGVIPKLNKPTQRTQPVAGRVQHRSILVSRQPSLT